MNDEQVELTGQIQCVWHRFRYGDIFLCLSLRTPSIEITSTGGIEQRFR